MRYKNKITSFIIILAAFTVFAVASPIYAATTNTKSDPSVTQTLTKTYNADPSVQIGMLVKLKKGDTNSVVALDGNSVRDLLGVAVSQNSTSLSLTPSVITAQQVLVTTSGRVGVLVSNQNGPIKSGDGLAVSSIDGVAMAAAATQKQIIGKAAGDFNGKNNVIGTITVKDNLNKQQKVTISRLYAVISPSSNPQYQQQVDFVPGFMTSIANTAAGKSVSVARIYMSLAVLVSTVIIAGNLMYAGVRSGMIAVGRNPLSKKSIIRSLIQTAIVALIVFIIGVFAVYLLLKL